MRALQHETIKVTKLFGLFCKILKPTEMLNCVVYCCILITFISNRSLCSDSNKMLPIIVNYCSSYALHNAKYEIHNKKPINKSFLFF
jgi:hypothetical protein